jgi:hypothetical protein
VASLCATAALAIGILLFGEFGATQGRILTSTLLVGAFGLLGVPAAVLLDQGRHRRLALANGALAAAGLLLMLVVIWWGDDPPVALARSALSVTAFALAAGQIAALGARRRRTDPSSVRRLYLASTAIAVVLAAMAGAAIWLEIESLAYYRVLGALAVLDVLLVALQPILAKVHARETTLHTLRLEVEPDGAVELTVAGEDFARAVASAIRQAERSGGRVVRIARIDPPGARAGGAPGARLTDSVA